ncbi:MAG TPA: trypsin-like serine protease [Solirubrobacterales bacterium]|nr:trypsin-like serine protease [Solirubrobacterales bacterium]
MLRVLSFCLLALLTGFVSSASAVVNGTPAKLSDFPYFSVVGTGCGGALVKPDRVLTAAHCRDALNESDKVRVGPDRVRRTVKLRAMLPLHVRELAKMEREYPPPAGDLMILALNRPVRGVPLARIATSADDLTTPGNSVTTIGRGAIGSDGKGQGTFRSGVVEIQPGSSCEEALGTPLLRKWSICTRDPRMDDPADRGPFVSACVGDSGGPLLANGGAGNRVIGVVSWGPSCGEQRDPEIYANAVAGRGFALAPKPAWVPQAKGAPKVIGRTAVGETVRCRVRWVQKPTRDLSYGFYLDGRQVQAGGKATYRLRREARGSRISCDGQGATAGGRGGSLKLAPYRLVR